MIPKFSKTKNTNPKVTCTACAVARSVQDDGTVIEMRFQCQDSAGHKSSSHEYRSPDTRHGFGVLLLWSDDYK